MRNDFKNASCSSLLKNCPNLVDGQPCGKAMKIKIKKSDGKKFYSCMPPKFGGNGCGHIENVN